MSSPRDPGSPSGPGQPPALPFVPVLLALGLAFAAVPLLRGEIFFFWDNAKLYYPQTVSLHEGLRAGGFPEWEHAASAGYPLIGEGQAAHFHPVHLLFTWILPPHVAFMLEIGLYTALAGLGTYLFVRHFRAGWPAFLAGLLAMFGGFPVVAVKNVAHTRSLWVIPFVMLLAELYVRGGSKVRWLLLAGLGTALQLLSGNPHYAALTAVGSGLWVLLRTWQRTWHFRRPLPDAVWTMVAMSAGWIVAPLVGFGLAAIQVIPQLMHVEQSTRAAGMSFEFAMAVPANLRYLGQLLLPFAYEQGHLLDPGVWSGRDFNEVSYRGLYMGVATVVLSVVALWRSRPWPDPVRPLAALGVIGTLLALGEQTPLGPALWSLPMFGSLRFPHRFLAITAFCLATMGGLGLGRLTDPDHELPSGARRSLFVPVAFVVLAAFGGAAVLWLAPPPWLLITRDGGRGIVLSLCLVLAAASLVLVASAMDGRRRQVVCLALIAFTAADLWYFRARSDYAPTLPRAEVMSVPPAAEFLAADTTTFRIMSLEGWEEASIRVDDLREFVQANTNRLWDIDSADQYSSLMLGRYFLVHQRIVQELLRDPRSIREVERYLGAWNVKYIVTPDSMEIPGWERAFETERGVTWQNPHVLPRAFVVGDVVGEQLVQREEWAVRARARLGRFPETLPDWDDWVAESQIVDNIMEASIDYSETGVVAGWDGDLLDPGEWSVTGRTEGDDLIFEVDASGPGLLVVSSTHYPGWNATVNGEAAAIHRANWVMSGIAVPGGRSEVVMTFATPGRGVGAAISMGVLLLVALAFFSVPAIRTNRREEPSPP